jgi:hypothetical protein
LEYAHGLYEYEVVSKEDTTASRDGAPWRVRALLTDSTIFPKFALVWFIRNSNGNEEMKAMQVKSIASTW